MIVESGLTSEQCTVRLPKGYEVDFALFDQPDIDKQISDIKKAYAMDIPQAIIALNSAYRMFTEGEK